MHVNPLYKIFNFEIIYIYKIYISGASYEYIVIESLTAQFSTLGARLIQVIHARKMVSSNQFRNT